MAMPRQLARAKRTRRCGKSQPRTVLEELPAIDARWLARKKLFPKDHSTRRYSFNFINPAIHTVTLGPRCAEFVFATGQTQLIAIKWLRISGLRQSARPAFQCPGCGHNAFKLFHHHGRFAGCYRCIGIPYASQQRSAKNRPRLQAARLRLFLSSSPDDTEAPAKQPFMWRRVYARFLARLHNLEANKSRKQKPITKTLSYKVLRPITAYDSFAYALLK
jgi:hypothetical protein